MIERASFHGGSEAHGFELAVEGDELLINDKGTASRVPFADLLELMVRREHGNHVFRIRARGSITERRFYRGVHSTSVDEDSLTAFLDIVALRAPGATIIRADGDVPFDALWAPAVEQELHPSAPSLRSQLPPWWIIAAVVAFVIALIATGAR